jgi:hypothetical protein
MYYRLLMIHALRAAAEGGLIRGAAATWINFPCPGSIWALTAACRGAVIKSQFVHVGARGLHCETRHFCCNDPRNRRSAQRRAARASEHALVGVQAPP